jgi:hypothetical protein
VVDESNIGTQPFRLKPGKLSAATTPALTALKSSSVILGASYKPIKPPKADIGDEVALCPNRQVVRLVRVIVARKPKMIGLSVLWL